MDPQRFTSGEFGEVTKQPGNRYAFYYFSPKPLPNCFTLSARLVARLSEADAALGELQGLARLVQEPELLVGPYLTREAVASSRIEGTQASLSDVLQAEAGGLAQARPEDVAEVERYLSAIRHAFDRLSVLPLSQRLIKEVHAVLLRGVRGEERYPGELRRSPVWIGTGNATLADAIFVPPLPEEVPAALGDWEDFVNRRDPDIPTLIRAGVAHYQFETIHPFLDGNGRIGRLIISLMLKEEDRLDHPLLYLSGYFEAHRMEYYERLQAVREQGDMEGWLCFFLGAVRDQARDAVQRVRNLVEIRERYLSEASQVRGRLPALIDLLMHNPYLTVQRVEQALGMTNAGARGLIRQAEDRGWVQKVGSAGRGGRIYWCSRTILNVIVDPQRFKA